MGFPTISGARTEVIYYCYNISISLQLEKKLKTAETAKDDSLLQALGVMKKYSGADELTQALIEKVIVTDPEHVEIVWKFKDEVRKFIGI